MRRPGLDRVIQRIGPRSSALIHDMRMDGNRAAPPRRVPWRPMGFNPFREESHSALDVVLVVIAVALTLALVAWGFFGG